MTTQPATAGDLATIAEQRIAASPPWLATRRRAAFDAFSVLPWPSSQRDEDWRRTDVAKLDPAAFTPDGGVGDELQGLIDATVERVLRHLPDAGVVICDHQGAIEMRGCDPLIAQGVLICALDEAATRHADLVQRALATVPATDQPIAALWNAMWRGGVFIHVPAAVEVSVPLVVIHAAAGDATATYPATVLVAGQASRSSLVEIHVSPPGSTAMLSNTTSVVVADRDATVNHALLQRHGFGVWHLAQHRATLDAGATLNFSAATLGSRLQKAYWETVLAGAGAEAHIAGIALARGAQHLDHQSLQAHTAPDTSSSLLLKVAARDNARSVYSGLIDVDKVAQRTDAYVQNRNLILGHGAKADSVPRLEIRAHDVKCGHGATAGHVDDEQRFYLMARGVPGDEADRIIIRGFFDDALARSPLPGFTALVGEYLDVDLAQDGGA